MAYQAIYRKWRPLVFDDIIGQTHVTKTLKNQIINGKTAHAYLFCGTRGTGKTTAAKVFARAVNCENPKDGSPCNECATCRGILDGSILDVAEIDAASNNGVDNIREIREDVNYVATQSKYRIYIIDEVHMLSSGAFNALLKTLEEPPEHVIFILATTEAHRVPQTILSRCQRFDFKRIKPSEIIVRMKEIATKDGLKIEEGAYLMIARFADGSMRDALSIMERCISESNGTLTSADVVSALGLADFECVQKSAEAILEKDTKTILELIEDLSSMGRDLNVYIDSLSEHFKNLTVCKVTDTPESLLDIAPDDMVKLKAQAEKMPFEVISYAISVLTKAKADAKWVKNPRIIYELALIKLTRPELDVSNEALLARIEKLEEDIKKGVLIKEVEVKQEAPKKEEKPQKKAEPSARLYAPLDTSTLTSSSPIVALARRWDAIARAVSKKLPFVACSVINRPITIDGEGIILVYNQNEQMLKKIASTHIKAIKEAVFDDTGKDFEVKTALSSDVEGKMVDYWSFPDENPEAENDSKDPVDTLLDKFSEIVELTDQSEFVNYEHKEYLQTELSDNADDDEAEEFLEEHEMEEF